MFRATLLFVLLCLAYTAGFANEPICSKVANEAETSSISYYPSAEATVIGKGSVNFYSAPSTECKMGNVYVVKGNFLTLYKSYKGWVNVMYIAKDGKDFIGWVPQNRVKTVGQYGHNP